MADVVESQGGVGYSVGEGVLTDKPRRAIEITITIGADTIRDVQGALKSIEFNIMEHGDDMNITTLSGGTSSNYTIHGSHKPEITHDMYFEQLNKYLGKDGG